MRLESSRFLPSARKIQDIKTRQFGQNVVNCLDDTMRKVALALENIDTDDIITKSPWFDVRAFGAHSITEPGYETFDSSVPIQDAIDAANAVGGGTIACISGGIQIIGTDLVLYDNIRLTGHNSTLKIPAASNNNIIYTSGDPWTSSYDNIQIDGLTFDGNYANQTYVAHGRRFNCILIYNGTNIRVLNCNFKNVTQIAIDLIGAQYSLVSGNRIIGSGAAGSSGIQLHFNNETSPNTVPMYNVVSDNHIKDCASGGIHIRGAHHNTVVANPLKDSGTEAGSAAITLYEGDEDDGCEDNTVVGNVIDGCATGIIVSAHVTAPPRNTITGNTIANATVIGINATSIDGAISNNILVDGIVIGIRLTMAEDNIISGNRCLGSAAGIDIRGDYNTFIGNNVEGSENGIIISSAGTYDSNSIIGNNCRNCNAVGIKIDSGSNHTIRDNDCTGSTTTMSWGASAGSGLNIGNNTGVPIPSLADDATPSVNKGDLYLTGGTTTITALDDAYEGQVVTIIGAHSTTQLTDGSTLKLAGNCVLDTDDTIKLIFDGTNWHEISRTDVA